jgi:quercetin dioxygenase-like cupin family protein
MTSTPDHSVTDLQELGRALLDQALGEGPGRAAHTLPHSGPGLRQTLIALRAGAELAEHESPGTATLQVLRGRTRLIAGEATVELAAGQLGAIPPRRHSLHADQDAVVLLSVVHD